MSRTQAKMMFHADDQIKATTCTECRKAVNVIYEIPMVYNKDIDAAMAAQKDLIGGAHLEAGGARQRLIAAGTHR